ncbi:PqqD family protein [Falsihalocynthiibacter sp. BN13B15]|uniref:PqqD family protein n=1 Tax=Falsihalocynthiibacter sp. BN13B15 TaxID=3240871 RepID=UPI00350F93F8
MKLTSKFEIPVHVVSRQVDGELVILDLESGLYFGLNEVGARFFALASEGASVDAVYDAMLQEYDVDAETLECDIRSLVSELEQRKLITYNQN